MTKIILKHCDEILGIFSKNIDMSFQKSPNSLERKIEPQPRFIQKKKIKLLKTTMPSAEELIIEKSLKDGTDEILNISKQSSFDHSFN